jgi:hypothetical protein
MKWNSKSEKYLNAYKDGFVKGIGVGLKNQKLCLKKINPYHLLINHQAWEGFQSGAKDGFKQGIRQLQQHLSYKRLKEIDKLKSKSIEQER